MSMIGRVFSVLNVALAAIFLWSAGTFLQKHTYSKETLEQEVKSLEENLESVNSQLLAKDRELGDKKRQLQASEASLQSERTKVADLTGDNSRLEDRLSQMERDLKNVQSSLGTVSSSVDRASQLAANSQEQALKAATERDEAIRAKEVAVSDKTDMEVVVASLNTKIGDLESQLTEMTTENSRMENVLAVVESKLPGFLINVAPKFDGRLTNVGPQGRLVTMQITNAANLAKPGYEVAVWDSEAGYKAEVLLTEIYENGQAVGRVIRRPDGKPPVRIGDSFSSQTSF